MLRLLAFIALASAAYPPDQITNLPGAPAKIPFDQYAGYLVVNASHNRSIFYWFVQSMNDPVNDPLVLWTNGGPGCSGLIGFWTEQGPFRPQSDLTLNFTDYPWNKVANMLFIEAPAGVGFSYSDVISDYVTGDNQTAFDNYNAILAFLDKFPEYNNNSFYITSESYGGHYMPTLAKTIVDQNNLGVNKKINFKGFAVGNPYTDPISNNYGAMTTFGGHQLVDLPTYEAWLQDCVSGEKIRCAEHEARMEMLVRGLNPYALDYPVCNSNAALGRAQRYRFLNFTLPLHRRDIALEAPYDPCVDNYATKYMNRADVQTAIHAKPTTWSECSNKISYSEQESLQPMEPYYHYLIAGGYKLNLLVYSGDDDSVCATSGSQFWIWSENYPVISPWAPWKYVDDEFGSQVGGYLVKFQGLTFATVHGAGHEVPTYKPQAALELFKAYLSGNW